MYRETTLDTTASLDSAEHALDRQRHAQRWRYLLRDKKALIGLITLTILVLAAIAAPLVVPFDPNAMDYEMIEAPSWTHPLGTDDLGRDLLSRLIYGTRISLFVGLSTVAISLVIGIVLGVVGGYMGGWFDAIIMRYIDLQWAFPNFIIAVYLVAVFGTGLSNVIVAISLAFIDDFARIARGMVLTIREEQYVDAAHTLGASDARIMWRHILPNAMAPLVAEFGLRFCFVFLFISALSFLGLGIQPPTADWGSMVRDNATLITFGDFTPLLAAGSIALLTVGVNFVVDWFLRITSGLRDEQ